LPLLAATISLGTPRELVDTLAKLLPRMYLISSSLRAHPVARLGGEIVPGTQNDRKRR